MLSAVKGVLGSYLRWGYQETDQKSLFEFSVCSSPNHSHVGDSTRIPNPYHTIMACDKSRSNLPRVDNSHPLD